MCARCGRWPVHPDRASPYYDATCAQLAHEHESKLERMRANAREWLYTRRGYANEDFFVTTATAEARPLRWPRAGSTS